MSNLFDAWKQAKDGQGITRTTEAGYVSHGTKRGSFKAWIAGLSEEALLADNWEVVRTKRTAMGKVAAPCSSITNCYHVEFKQALPMGAKVTAEWEE